MCWHPKKAELLIMDTTGHWGVVTDLAPSTSNETSKTTSSGNVAKSATSGNVAKKNDMRDDDEMLDDDEVTRNRSEIRRSFNQVCSYFTFSIRIH